MPQIFYFLLKVIMCSGILFGYYHLFLRNKVYHAYNRYYLLCAVTLSLTVPLFQFDVYNSNDETQLQPLQMLQVVNNSDAYIEEIIATSHTRNLEISDLLLTGYLAIALVFFISFVMLLFRVYSLIRKSEKNRLNNVILINSSAEGTPFSFFRYLFWNNAIDINTDTGRHVFSHELAHISERHSVDKIFLNVILIICWINPFFWLIRRELNMIHEFIADKKAVGQYDTAVLATMIIQAAYPKHNFLITNHFFYSPIKRRLQMLSKYRSTRTNYFTRILALPVLFMLIAAFTFKAQNSFKPKLDREYIVVIDAGHGGTDGGARAVDGTYEKNLNLALAKMVKELNTNQKIKIILTRESDVYQKPQEKAEIANKLMADLFISIHNSYTQEKFLDVTSGMEVYVARDSFQNSIKSKTFASAVIGVFSNNYPLKVNPNPIQRPTGVWILQASKCPTVLIEAGYLSNTRDRDYLKSKVGMETFAKNVLNAIQSYLTQPIASIKPDMPASIANVLGLNKEQVNITPGNGDTIPKFAKDLLGLEGEERILENVNMVLKSDGGDNNFEHALIILNNQHYDFKALENKNIVAKRALVYGKNSKKMLERYGRKAINGTIIFENGEIRNRNSGRYDLAIEKEKNNIVTDASQRNIFPDETPNRPVTAKIQQPSLIIVNGKEMGVDEVNKLDLDKIVVNVKVIEGKEAIEKFGERAVNGVMIVTSEQPMLSAASVKMSNPQSKDMLFTKVEVEAEFPGGSIALEKYFSVYRKNYNSAEDGLSAGKYVATIQFIVDKDGILSDIKSTDYASSKTTQHYIDMIKKGPKWIPALQNGRVVKSIKVLKVPFSVL